MTMQIRDGLGWVPDPASGDGWVKSAWHGDYIAEIERLRAALEHIASLPDVRCDEAATYARNTLNDGAVPPPIPNGE